MWLAGKMSAPEAAASHGCEPAAAQSADTDVGTHSRRLVACFCGAIITHLRGLCPLAELKLRFTPTSFLQCKKEAKKTFAASPLLFFLFYFFIFTAPKQITDRTLISFLLSYHLNRLNKRKSQIQKGCHKKNTVKPVKYSAVSRYNTSEILYHTLPFKQRSGKISDNTQYRSYN